MSSQISNCSTLRSCAYLYGFKKPNQLIQPVEDKTWQISKFLETTYANYQVGKLSITKPKTLGETIASRLFSPSENNNTVLAIGPHNSSYIVDPCIWKLRRVIKGHRNWINAVCVDSDNEYFFTGSTDTTIKVWQLASGKLQLTLTGHKAAVRAVAISREYPYLFSGGDDLQIKLWDLETNTAIRLFHGHNAAVHALSSHQHLPLVASGSRDGTVKLWDSRSSSPVMNFVGHEQTVHDVLLQSHEPQLISSSADRTIRTWDLRTSSLRDIKTHHTKGVRSIAAHPNLQAYVSAGADSCKLWGSETLDYVHDLQATSRVINSVVVQCVDRGTRIIGGSNDGHVCVWDWESGRLIRDIVVKHIQGDTGINAIALDRSETRFITVHQDRTIRMWAEDE